RPTTLNNSLNTASRNIRMENQTKEMAQKSQAQNNGNGMQQEAPKKRNKTFIIVLALLVLGGGGFGITKYVHSLSHEETDDAQVEASISPVIPRIGGYIAEVRVQD